ncbi:MAG: hypothetical protein J0M07_30585, partial [Anaerolineae bacterium]|nr:hypothetical protein [Anaerolineae bacterium]
MTAITTSKSIPQVNKPRLRLSSRHLPVTAHRVVKAAAEAAGLACFDVSFDDSDCIDSVLSTLG